MADLPLFGRWIVARFKLTLRNPRALTFTLAFPLVLVVLFNALNGDTQVTSAGVKVDFSQFYTPAIGIFSLATACYTSLILGIATARDSGLLKRVHGTPLPMWIYIGAWIIGASLVGILAVVIMFAVSVPAFGVTIYARSLPSAILILVLGAACLSACGIAVASLVKTADQAMPVAQFTFLPLSFISGIWYPLDGAPDWLITLARIFPLYHIAHAFERCFVPGTGAAWPGKDLWAIVAWTAIGGFVAVRRFRFEPGEGGATGRGLLGRRGSTQTATA